LSAQTSTQMSTQEQAPSWKT